MKKSSLLVSLMVLASLVGCKAENSSSSSVSQTGSSPVSSVVTSSSEEASSSVVSSSSSSSSEASSSSSEASSEASSSSSAVESSSSSSSSVVDSSSSSSSDSAPVEVDLLGKLKQGFAARSTFVEQDGEDDTSPSVELLETYVGDGVAKIKQFSGSSWDSESLKLSKAYQYEEDAEGNANVVSVDTAGNPVANPLMLLNTLASKDIHAFWSETYLENAFSYLENENFVKQDDGSYELDFSSIPSENYEAAVTGLANQFYMVIDGGLTHYFIKLALTSFSLNVDDIGNPVSYSATFEDSEVDFTGWGDMGTRYTSISGEFIGIGAGQVEKITSFTESKYPELDEAFAKLRKGNYNAYVHRIDNDMWDGLINEYMVVSADGVDATEATDSTPAVPAKANFEVEYTKKTMYSSTTRKFGYKQLTDETYRKYEMYDKYNVFTGETFDGSALEDVLPQFTFDSNLFEKDPSSTNYISTYRYKMPELIDSTWKLDKDITDFGFNPTIYGFYLSDLMVEVTANYVRFTSNDATRSVDAKFYNIGKVKTISTTVKESNDLISGSNYTGSTTINRFALKFQFAFGDDNTIVITKNEEVFGTFNYSFDASGNIVVEDLENSVFQFTGKDWSDNEFFVNCYINPTITISDYSKMSLKVTFNYQKVDAESWSNTNTTFSVVTE